MSASIAALLLVSSSAFAQLPGGPGSFNPALLQLFSAHGGFTGTAELRVMDAQRRDKVRTVMGMSYLGGKVRAEVKLGDITSQSLNTDALDLFKKAGMDPVVSILRPDRLLSFVAFPTARVFAEEAMPPEEAAEFNATYKIDRAPQGSEMVDGKKCERSAITITPPKGAPLHGTIWTAAELKGFPVKIQLPEGTDVLEMVFKNVKLDAPSAELFEAPKGFRKHDAVDKLIAERMKAMASGGK